MRRLLARRTASRRSATAYLLVTGLLAGCAGPGGPPPSGVATQGPTSQASPTPAGTPRAPTSAPGPVPSMTTIAPTAVIGVPNSTGVIAVATDGKSVWAATTGAILRIDTATNTVESLSAPTQSDDTVLSLSDDGLWVARWAGGHLYRLDPRTGEVLLAIDFPKAVRIQHIGEDLWAGREDTSSMYLVDRQTGAIRQSIARGAYATAGLGDLWFTVGLGPRLERVDPASGAVKATIDAKGESNCNLSGAFPDSVWLTCFGRDVTARSASRIDPTSNSVATIATLPPTHGGSVVMVNGRPWFIGTFEDATGQSFAGLLLLNPGTGSIERFISIGPADADASIVAGAALWIPDEANHRIIRVDVAELGG